jgi:hypothetical protein
MLVTDTDDHDIMLIVKKSFEDAKDQKSPPVFSEVRVARSLVYYVVLCRLLFALLSVFFWPLCCLSFDFLFRITPLESSNFS